jgi:hypothetical protein
MLSNEKTTTPGKLRGRKKKNPKCWYIEWEDPASEHAGWFDLTEEELSKLHPAVCRSVGWILKENKKYIILVPHLIDKDNLGSGDTSIPKSLISKKVEIKLEKMTGDENV